MNWLTYNDVEITVLRQTQNPAQIVQLACDITQKQVLSDSCKSASRCLIDFCLKADHQSVLEHAQITFLIRNVSRSFLAQLTRHRMASYTCSSQHYQDYRDYPMVVHPESDPLFAQALEDSLTYYTELIDAQGMPPQEARQVLPNACACTLLWTMNPVSLINFFRKRMCKRNTDEMHMFAWKVYEICCKWYPELFENVGTYCQTEGVCNQGKMSCGDPYDKICF